jgi:predicted acetyltransferase
MPATTMHESFVAALREFRRDNGSRPGYVDRLDPDELVDVRIFAEFVDHLCADPVEEAARTPGLVPQTTLWWCAGHTEFIGRLAIRHYLIPALEREGGHIGYDVRPSARRQGHGTAMVKAALPVARYLGVDRALITCDSGNIASRRVIEKNGGELIDDIGGVRRFWVPTG